MLRQRILATSWLKNPAKTAVKNSIHIPDYIYVGNRKVDSIRLRSIIPPWLWCFVKFLLNYARKLLNKSKIIFKVIYATSNDY